MLLLLLLKDSGFFLERHEPNLFFFFFSLGLVGDEASARALDGPVTSGKCTVGACGVFFPSECGVRLNTGPDHHHHHGCMDAHASAPPGKQTQKLVSTFTFKASRRRRYPERRVVMMEQFQQENIYLWNEK